MKNHCLLFTCAAFAVINASSTLTAATVVTTFPENTRDITIGGTKLLEMGEGGMPGEGLYYEVQVQLGPSYQFTSWIAYAPGLISFTNGSNLVSISGARGNPDYYSEMGGGFQYGAIEGTSNYANFSFDADDGIYETVVQFKLLSDGLGSIIAMARNEDGSALSIADGYAAINSSAIPEPASAAATLSLLAGGLLIRRRGGRA